MLVGDLQAFAFDAQDAKCDRRAVAVDGMAAPTNRTDAQVANALFSMRADDRTTALAPPAKSYANPAPRLL